MALIRQRTAVDGHGELRNINYFIENCVNENVDTAVRNNYIGLARFFRAYFYYMKVVRFGDVPWIDKTFEVDSEELYAGRDPRTVVMDHVLEDLNFACENITRTKDETGSLVTKWVAYALKSRICLFEVLFVNIMLNWDWKIRLTAGFKRRPLLPMW